MTDTARNQSPTQLRVTDDWPDEIPITRAEVKLIHAHMVDIIASILEHEPE